MIWSDNDWTYSNTHSKWMRWSLLVVVFFSSAMFLYSYKYQEIAHIYLQDNLFGVVDIAFTLNECYYRFNHCRIKSLTRGLAFPAIYLLLLSNVKYLFLSTLTNVVLHTCEFWYAPSFWEILLCFDLIRYTLWLLIRRKMHLPIFSKVQLIYI
jgi:hypothetical protein